MPIYTVHEPPSPPAGRLERGEALVFVRDGFSWRAALFPPGWFAIRREWLGLAVYAGAIVALALLLAALGAKQDWVALSMLALHVIFGFEASELQRWSLTRAGWREIGSVGGPNRETCERRFFDGWLENQPAISTYRPSPIPEIRALGASTLEEQLRNWLERIRGRFEQKAGR